MYEEMGARRQDHIYSAVPRCNSSKLLSQYRVSSRETVGKEEKNEGTNSKKKKKVGLTNLPPVKKTVDKPNGCFGGEEVTTF